jgi:hypothetical protein
MLGGCRQRHSRTLKNLCQMIQEWATPIDLTFQGKPPSVKWSGAPASGRGETMPAHPCHPTSSRGLVDPVDGGRGICDAAFDSSLSSFSSSRHFPSGNEWHNNSVRPQPGWTSLFGESPKPAPRASRSPVPRLSYPASCRGPGSRDCRRTGMFSLRHIESW